MTSRLSRLLLALLFVAGGVNHFVAPATYLQIMPPFLPAHGLLIYLSGVAEILGGFGLLFAPTRRLAALGLIGLLILVFPANIYAVIHGVKLGDWIVPAWLLWLRLPLQAVLIAWVYIAGWKARQPPR